MTQRGAAQALIRLGARPLTPRSIAIDQKGRGRCPACFWELGHNVTAYDAVYLALAEALAAPLVTRGTSLVSAPGHHARIEIV